ncbi:MAG: O-antigen ligase family protein [Nanoarchaeota archaeon]
MKIDVLLVFLVALGYGMFFLNFPIIFNIVPIVFVIFLLLFIKNKNLFLRLIILSMPILTGGAYFSSIMNNSMFGIGILGILNILIPLLVFFTLFFKRPKDSSFGLNTPIIVFLFILGCGIFYSPSFVRSTREWFRIAMPISLYYLVLNIGLKVNNKKEFFLKIIKCVILSSLIPLFVGFFQLINGDSRFVVGGLKRIYSTFGHPNNFAAFLIVCISLLFFMFVNENKSRKKCFYLACILLMLFSLIFTFARIGWIAFFVCFSVIGVMKYRKHYVLFIVAIMFICLYMPAISNPLFSRLKPDSSFYLRFSLNQFSWDLFEKSPLFGHGLASYPFLSKQHFGFVSTMYGQEVGLPQHNDYLRFLTEDGVLGLIAYLFFIFLCLKLSFRIAEQKDTIINSFGCCLIGIILATLVLGLSDQGLKMVGIYPWILLGLGELLLKHSTNHKKFFNPVYTPINKDI